MSFRRDRFRTMVNVMGDALATGIMAHICRKDFVKEGEQVRNQQTPKLKIVLCPVEICLGWSDIPLFLVPVFNAFKC